MPFTEQLKSADPSVIKDALCVLLDESTSPDILAIHKAFNEAEDKHQFLAQFEADESVELDPASEAYAHASERSAQFERWTHYLWLRLELVYLANQKAALNHVMATKEQAKAQGVVIPSLDSIGAAIQAGSEQGISITQSIKIISKMTLQSVGTEHPTDPLSQKARDGWIGVANAMDQDNPNADAIKTLLANLMTTDAIPHTRRTVTEEVHRNIDMMLSKLYDNLPRFAQEIMTTYKTHYGEETYKKHELAIVAAVEKMCCDAFWPGFDADGNDNVTAAAMLGAIRIYRQRICEKHVQTLKDTVYESTKKIEHSLRKDFNRYFKEFSQQARKISGVTAESILYALDDFKESAANLIDTRQFFVLKKHYDDMCHYIQSQLIDEQVKKELLAIMKNLLMALADLIEIIRFSGDYREGEHDVLHGGDLQQFQKIFSHYRQTISDDSDAITIKNEQGQDVNATTFVNECYSKLMTKHSKLLTKYPDIKQSVQNFKLQLSAFGMTYGKGHMRQDSSVFQAVWNGLFADIMQHSKFAHYDFLKPWQGYLYRKDYDAEFMSYDETIKKDTLYLEVRSGAFYYRVITPVGKDIMREISAAELLKYGLSELTTNDFLKKFPQAILDILADRGHINKSLTQEQRIAFHKYLQNGSAQSQAILDDINQKRSDESYASDKYKSNPHFVRVTEELERLKHATRHKDIVEKLIISNCEGADDILAVESLYAVFPDNRIKSSLRIVPLLEKPEDLRNYETILLDYIKTKIQYEFESVFDQETANGLDTLKNILGIQNKADIKNFLESKNRQTFAFFVKEHPELKNYLANTVIEVMLGFSDTERVSGLAALLAIKQVQENLKQLMADFGVTLEIYLGPGGDISRGGDKTEGYTRTVQGEARNKAFDTPTSTQWFREKQFSAAYKQLSNLSVSLELADMPEEIKDWRDECMAEGMAFYEQLHDTKEGFGKLLSVMLGQLWIVPMLNSSSRATKRGGQDKSGDRTSAVQTGGKMPEPIVDLKNSRAITAVQLKEMLRQYLDCIGPGAGLRKIGVEKAAWLYDRSETFRDMVLKVNMATELRDPKFNAHALFAGHPNLSPKDDAQKRQWAQECKDHYPELLQTLDIEKMCKDPEQSDKLLGMLSRLFAYLEVEWDETQQFLLQMRQHIYPKETGSLISHYPMLQKQIEDVTYEGEPLSYILARQAQHVANGRKLDQVYPGINKQKIPGSLLSGVARMIGNAGTGLTAFRKMLSGFCENLFADFRDNLRPGSIRALHEAAKINRAMAILPHREKTVCRFFDQEHINELETRLQNRPGVTAS